MALALAVAFVVMRATTATLVFRAGEGRGRSARTVRALRSNRVVHRYFLIAGAIALSGCALAPADDEPSRAGQAIFGGERDLEHEAVGALDDGSCTGTVVAVHGDIGYFLTAAHCLKRTPRLVVLGSHVHAPDAKRFAVLDATVHPYFANGLYDFGIVRFSGADASTPTMELLEDHEAYAVLAPGARIVLVGYGETDGDEPGARRSVAATITRVDLGVFEYAQRGGGACHGDSGGPAVAVVGGRAKLVGVTSFGDAACAEYGASGTVSAARAFVRTQVEPSERSTCASCAAASDVCSMHMSACAARETCRPWLTCLSPCPPGDAACAEQCARAPESRTDAELFARLSTCVCGQSCAQACGAAPACAVKACGGVAARLSCRACVESRCCAEARACASEDACREAPGAAGTPTDRALSTCAAAACAKECASDARLLLRADRDRGAEATTASCHASPSGVPASRPTLLVVMLGLAAARLARRRATPC